LPGGFIIMRSLTFALLGLVAVVLAACSGTQSVYTAATAAPTAQAMGNVSFLVIVPSANQSATKRRNVVLPSNAQSVTITLNSVNGTAYTGTPTSANLSSSASGCTATSAQLSCIVNVSVPAGTLVFTVSAYSGASGGGTLIATGNLSVTATPGQTVNAPTTIGGTLAKIVVTVGGAAELGATASLPVTVQGEDANGDTILGTYSSPISLSDSDASSQTTVSPTSVPDSTTAATVVLNYLGGAMPAAATIGASATGVSASSVTSGSFSPDQTNPTVNANSVTFDTSYQEGSASGSVQPTPGSMNTGSYSYVYQTGQTFNGVSNAIEIDGDYYVWTAGATSSSLGYLGWANGSEESDLCASPYNTEFVIPIPSSWNVYQGAGACTQSYGYDDTGYTPPLTETDTTIGYADGSYTNTDTYNYTGCCAGDFGTGNYTVASSGAATQVENEGGGSDSVTLSAPAAGSSTLNASYVVYPSGTFPPSGTPTPTATTVPNPWIAIGASPAPALQSDVYTTQSPISTLPVSCNVPSSILGTNPTLTEIDETSSSADPLGENETTEEYLYEAQTTKHYYLAGVGQVCFTYNWVGYYYDEGVVSWVNGNDQFWDACSNIETDSLTTTSLQAAIKKRSISGTVSVPISAILEAAGRARIHAIERARMAKARQRLLKRRAQLAAQHTSRQ
jgi:hypothetical protein